MTKNGGFKAIVSAGTININLDKESGSGTTYGSCSAWLYAPLNTGDLKAQGNSATEVVIFQANNTAPAGDQLILILRLRASAQRDSICSDLKGLQEKRSPLRVVM